MRPSSRRRQAEGLSLTHSQEQVDKIFDQAAMAANKARIPLAKMAVEETGRGVLEDKVIRCDDAAEHCTMRIRTPRPAA